MSIYKDMQESEKTEGTCGNRSKADPVHKTNHTPQCLRRSPLPQVPSSNPCKSSSSGKRPLGSYTPEERSRGGINRAAKARSSIHDLIESLLPIAVKLSQLDCSQMHDIKARFVMSDFVKQYLPLKNAKSGVKNYGNFIKAKLKYYESIVPVVRMGAFIDKIRAGLARKNANISTVPIFQAMKGIINRLSSDVHRTSCERLGGTWHPKMGLWCYFVVPDTGECFN